jgi:hypothetical protein
MFFRLKVPLMISVILCTCLMVDVAAEIQIDGPGGFRFHLISGVIS